MTTSEKKKYARDKDGVMYPYQPSPDLDKIIINGEEVKWEGVYDFPSFFFVFSYTSFSIKEKSE